MLVERYSASNSSFRENVSSVQHKIMVSQIWRRACQSESSKTMELTPISIAPQPLQLAFFFFAFSCRKSLPLTRINSAAALEAKSSPPLAQKELSLIAARDFQKSVSIRWSGPAATHSFLNDFRSFFVSNPFGEELEELSSCALSVLPSELDGG
eukprot:Gregarina_sp_Poly_1__7202@NODE_3953_length_809_cov_243_194070_g1810_i1_p1_GENE_NODE_3953_length_809_cov_243_194070_g1810_i1NODE_3953_length_809_cov_243_194070_g1810_i1_p1_ORF_typecomplete_len154_score18_88DotD/PF16816_5/0_14_NODE_3953_length_809_cov_243_194070_g1810_i1314775